MTENSGGTRVIPAELHWESGQLMRAGRLA